MLLFAFVCIKSLLCVVFSFLRSPPCLTCLSFPLIFTPCFLSLLTLLVSDLFSLWVSSPHVVSFPCFLSSLNLLSSSGCRCSALLVSYPPFIFSPDFLYSPRLLSFFPIYLLPLHSPCNLFLSSLLLFSSIISSAVLVSSPLLCFLHLLSFSPPLVFSPAGVGQALSRSILPL